MSLEECFKVLNIEPWASYEDAKKAYRKLVFEWHPDKYTTNPKMYEYANDKIKKINEAWSILNKYYRNSGSSKQNSYQSQNNYNYNTTNSSHENTTSSSNHHSNNSNNNSYQKQKKSEEYRYDYSHNYRNNNNSEEESFDFNDRLLVDAPHPSILKRDYKGFFIFLTLIIILSVVGARYYNTSVKSYINHLGSITGKQAFNIISGKEREKKSPTISSKNSILTTKKNPQSGNNRDKDGRKEKNNTRKDNIDELSRLKSEGYAMLREHRNEDAIAIYDKVLQIDSTDAGAWRGKAIALLGLGRIKEAIFAFEQSINYETDEKKVKEMRRFNERLKEALESGWKISGPWDKKY